jgi:hypothetical protein
MDRRGFVAAAAGAATSLALINSARSAPAETPASHASLSIFDFGAVGDGETDDSAAFNKALETAAREGRTVLVPGRTYAIARPIAWVSTNHVGQAWGLQCQGARLLSKLTKGETILSLTSKHTVRYFRLVGGLTITGTGSDGNGLHINCPGNSAFFYNATLEGLSIERTGIHGLLFEGNVFESAILTSFFQDCKKHGATFAHSHGGVCSAINVIGCFFNQNGEYGLCATNFDGPYGGTTDVRVYGGYCRDNQSYGFYYNNGTGAGCLEQVGFENNCRSLKPGDTQGAHIYGLNAMQLRYCAGYNEYGGATYLLRGWFQNLTVLEGCTQAAGGAVGATGKSRLVQVNGSEKGHVVVSRSGGGIDVVDGTHCTWSAANCTGPSPRGDLDIRGVVSSA